MKFLFIPILFISNMAYAGNCEFPYLNDCIQKNVPKCPQARFPDLRTPGLQENQLRPDDAAAIECRLKTMLKCAGLTLALDNNECLSGGTESINPFTKPSPTPMFTPKHSAQADPEPSPSPTDDDGGTDEPDTDVASTVK